MGINEAKATRELQWLECRADSIGLVPKSKARRHPYPQQIQHLHFWLSLSIWSSIDGLTPKASSHFLILLAELTDSHGQWKWRIISVQLLNYSVLSTMQQALWSDKNRAELWNKWSSTQYQDS